MAFHPTSDATEEYSCVSWALHYQRQVIWPDEREQYGWPPDIERSESLDAFRQFFTLVGFEECPNGNLEPAYEKVAVYVKNGLVSHAARQLPTGEWTSKMGWGADGSHPLDEFGDMFGRIELFLKRRAGQPPALPPLHPPAARLILPGGGPLLR